MSLKERMMSEAEAKRAVDREREVQEKILVTLEHIADMMATFHLGRTEVM